MSEYFEAQLEDIKTRIKLCESLPYTKEDLHEDSIYLKLYSDEDLAWRAYYYAFKPEIKTEKLLYMIYYILVERIPSLALEVELPACFRSALLTPDFFPTLDTLLSDYEYET